MLYVLVDNLLLNCLTKYFKIITKYNEKILVSNHT